MANPPLPALLLIPLLASCAMPEFTADAGYMFMALSGNVGFDDSGGICSVGRHLASIVSEVTLQVSGAEHLPYPPMSASTASMV